MARTELRVLICGVPAGTLAQDEAGLASFIYDEEYDGVPLSLSMPISNRRYGHRIVRPYLFGLLPDSEAQRRAIADEHDVSPNNPVMLLDHIGLDCPGAVQFCRTNDLEAVQTRHASYRLLSEEEVGLRLRAIRDDGDETWMGAEGRWSLGGNQGKIALAQREGKWFECLGSAATTHILKNGVTGFRHQALNEFVCMRTAAYCSIPVAHVDYLRFGDEYALVVERYDRLVDAQGLTRRLHQEDLCQALSVMPDQKYSADGGPTTAQVLSLLQRTNRASTNLMTFTRMLFFNCLIGAPDAHAKNYSVMLGSGSDVLIAPLYDVASGLAYDSLRRRGRLAMAIGGENRFGRVGSGAIRRYAGANDPRLHQDLEKCGVTEDWCLKTMADLAQGVPEGMTSAFDDATGAPGSDELRDRLEPYVRQNCERILALL